MQVVPPGTPVHRVPVSVRLKRYPHRRKSQPPGARKDRLKRARWRDDPGGAGQETIAELQLCPACSDQVEAQGPVVHEALEPPSVDSYDRPGEMEFEAPSAS